MFARRAPGTPGGGSGHQRELYEACRINGLALRLLDAPARGRSNTRPSTLGGQVAQLVEQRTENPRVGGSIPPLATIKSNN
jgi:hypothetical protein